MKIKNCAVILALLAIPVFCRALNVVFQNYGKEAISKAYMTLQGGTDCDSSTARDVKVNGEHIFKIEGIRDRCLPETMRIYYGKDDQKAEGFSLANCSHYYPGDGERASIRAYQDEGGYWYLNCWSGRITAGTEIRIKNRTNKRIQPKIFYCGHKGLDKGYEWWPLVTTEELPGLIDKARSNNVFKENRFKEGLPAITLGDFDPAVYPKGGRKPEGGKFYPKDLLSSDFASYLKDWFKERVFLTDEMYFRDFINYDYMIGVMVRDPTDAKKDTEVYYEGLIPAKQDFISDFIEEGGKYYFRDPQGNKKEAKIHGKDERPVC